MKTDLKTVQDADHNEIGPGADLFTAPEAHGIELHEEELEQICVPSKFKNYLA